MTHADPSHAATPKRVFLVDDHPMVREHLTLMIEQQPDMQVCGGAVDLARALEGIGLTQPDIAIIDISLRSSNGLDLIKEVRSRGWSVPILVLSMHEDSLYAERALRAGAQGYINKQESSKTILTAIRRVIDGQIHVSPGISEILLKRAISGAEKTDMSPVASLADREFDVFQLIGRGLSTRKIAQSLGLSIKTIETYRGRIKEKLLIDDGVQLMRRAMQWVEEYDARDH